VKLDTQTLIFILSLTYIAQVIAFFVQYRIVNRTYYGVGWWLLGSALMALGVILMPLVTVPSLENYARVANPLMVLGQIFLYIGFIRFLDKRENRWMISLIYISFILIYYYYMYFNNDISSRTIVINTTLALISVLTAYELFFKKDRFISRPANFTAIVFLAYGFFLTMRVFFTISMPPVQMYQDQAASLNAGFIVPTVTSNLWTFGFILIVNQRLNLENLLEKEKMQLIFNTSPDAAAITRLSDGLLLDVNSGFTALFGYARDEVLGTSTIKNHLWHNLEDRQLFLAELNSQRSCKNREFVFRHKNGSHFFGMISASIIEIQAISHIVSVIRDITEQKRAEQQIQKLIQQLETEKNTAQHDSITDSLTGLSNRRCFDVALNNEFYRLKRSGETLSLIMLDIDQFKNFNDSYGHLAGDECLTKIGTMLNTIIGRKPDIVARYGGEEFAVILPETDSLGAQTLAKKIRKGVEELAIPHATSDVAEFVTVSLGVVSVKTTNLLSPKQIIAMADEALYCSKDEGRDRVTVYKDNVIIDRI
jgi:diguanylate cyclase (GGDEF)-like protein/PAS domain S-box-containing protein